MPPLHHLHPLTPFSLALLLLVLLPSITTACCASAFTITALTSTSYPPFTTSTTTNHTAQHPRNATIAFTLHDPDPASNSTTTCAITWPAAAPAPHGWLPCADPAFRWRFGDDEDAVGGWDGAASFGLGVEHAFEDDRYVPGPRLIDARRSARTHAVARGRRRAPEAARAGRNG